MLYTLRFFSSKCRLFHNATFFGFSIIHILHTGCAKILNVKLRCQKVKEGENVWCFHLLASASSVHLPDE